VEEHMGNVTLLKSTVEQDKERWIGRVIVEIGERILLIERPWEARSAALAWCEDTKRQFSNDTEISWIEIRQPLLKRVWRAVKP
jgi:hypothetical protein